MVSAAKARAQSSCSEHPTHSRRGALPPRARVTAGVGALGKSTTSAQDGHMRARGLWAWEGGVRVLDPSALSQLHSWGRPRAGLRPLRRGDTRPGQHPAVVRLS